MTNKRIENQNKISLMDMPGQYKLIARKTTLPMRRVLESGRYILGPEIIDFENNFANYCKAKYCVGVSSGTEALYLALKALGVGPGDEVVTVPNTFTATAEVIALVGAKVVFCDIDPKNMNMDPNSLNAKITKKTKAVIPVHLHGNPVDMDEIYKITNPKKIAVIEDAAQAHGGRYKGKIIGSLRSQFTCFSFHPVKNLGAFGDAGGVVTNNKKLANIVRQLINHGRGNHHFHVLIGTTGRLDALQAVVLNVKLAYLESWISAKTKLAENYKSLLAGVCEFIQVTENSDSAHHVIAILTPQRDKLAEYLKSQGIETGMHYPVPLHLQPAYKYLGYKKGDFPIAEYYAKHTLSLPLYPHMTKVQVETVAQKVKDFYAGKRR